MKRFLCALCIILSLAFNAPIASAHPGKTDAQGGHTDRSTGEYHYHHGYPEHQHSDLNGDGIFDCPYDFEDKTDHESSSITSDTNRTTYTIPYTIPSTSPPPATRTETVVKPSNSGFSFSDFIDLVFGLLCSFLVIRFIFWPMITVFLPTKKTDAVTIPPAPITKKADAVTVSAAPSSAAKRPSPAHIATIDERPCGVGLIKSDTPSMVKDRAPINSASVKTVAVDTSASTSSGKVIAPTVSPPVPVEEQSASSVDMPQAPSDPKKQSSASLAHFALKNDSSIKQIDPTESLALELPVFVKLSIARETEHPSEEEYRVMYEGKSLLELSGAPENAFIDSEGLPGIKDGFLPWGKEYTFCSSPHGSVYHRPLCNGQATIARNAYEINNPYYRARTGDRTKYTPCKKCKPVLPDTSWYDRYKRIRTIKRAFNIK